MKTLAQYLAEYLATEGDRCRNSVKIDARAIELMKEWIEGGIDAYQSTENCTIGICGGDCPDCDSDIPMERGAAMLYNGQDEIEVCKYECPECGYVVYG